MMRYRLTSPQGFSGYRDLNAAAVTMYRRKGWTVELTGKSFVVVVDED